MVSPGSSQQICLRIRNGPSSCSECERELHKAELALEDDMRVLAIKYPMNETDEHRAAIAAWEAQ